MLQNITDILMVGPQGPFGEIVDHLEEQESCRLHCASDYDAASAYLTEHSPSLIILTIMSGEQDRAEALASLKILKNVAPVFVFSPTEDVDFHTTAIHNGAYDFFTAYTPLSEVDQALNAIVTFQPCNVS